MTKNVGRNSDQFNLRFPNGLRDRIKDAAAANSRSMNAEIIATLEEKYPPEKMPFSEFMRDFVGPILNAETLQEKRRLVELANKQAYAHYRGITVHLGKDGYPSLTVSSYTEK